MPDECRTYCKGKYKMATDFDEFQLYDPLLRMEGGKLLPLMSDVWVGSMSRFYQTLISYLSQFGVFIPNLTTEQRDTIQTPQNGQMIYNTTLQKPQIYEDGAWKTFTTT